MTERLRSTVLYVDDDEANRSAFCYLFQKAGFDVKAAASGGDALRLLAERPDLVVLDVNLPDIDGFEVCRRIKTHPATTGIPVLHLSGVYVRPEDKRHGLAGGADAYLTKPVDPQDLLAQARALLRGHRAEEEARAAAGQLQTTLDALDDGVGLLDRAGRVLRCNRALPRLLGKSLAEVLGRPCYELTSGTPGDATASALRRMLATRRPQVAEFARGDRWLRAVADPKLGPDCTVEGAVYVLSDVTERKHLEEQLRQAQALEALGRLAGEVAHDCNNLLTAITANVELLLDAAPDQPPDRAALVALDQAAWRLAELTRQLLKSSRRARPRLQPTDLGSCLEEVAGLFGPTAPRITLEVRAAPGLWAVPADPGQINRALMNLCANARDAMPEGGRLLLEAENAPVDAARARSHADARPGEFVRLRVRDTGLGIPPEVLPRIFEPFFSTKPPEHGSGLGLAVVSAIVRQHQGWIECSSTVNQGTCFDVYLPRSG